MRIAIAGSTGFIGTALCHTLRAHGHEIIRLVRREPKDPGERQWRPEDDELDPNVFDGVEAVVNLCGAGVGDHRWTRRYKREIYDSRVGTTALIASTLANLKDRPRVFVSASGINYYGSDRGLEILDEDSSPGSGFLATLCPDWEDAASPARDAAIAVCHPRFGIIMHRSGGALARMLPLFTKGLGGTLASGDQYWSHVSLMDVTNAIRFLIEEHGCVGPYNVTAPEPVTNGEFTRFLGQALRRPALMRAPGLALRIALGEYADDVVGSLRVIPQRLVDGGFRHHHPDVQSVIAAALEDFTPAPRDR